MIGQTVSHYKILEKLGEGGMGVVYKAEDTRLGRAVALKFLPPDLTRDEIAKERFTQEAQAASALDHSNICTIYEINETEDGRIYMAMACYAGQTLKQKIAEGPLGIGEAVDIALQIAAGLSKAHEKGIVHRDIKPANIFVTEDGGVKIVDFGLAKLTGREGLTKTGTTVGTVAYMSPEQCYGEEVDGRSDIWSLGVVFYEMLTGRRPFGGEHEQAVVYSILNHDPDPAGVLRAAVPDGVIRVVTRAMEKDPDDRFGDLAGFVADLRAATRAPRVAGVRRGARSRWRTPVPYVLLAALLVLVVASIDRFLRPEKKPHGPPAYKQVTFLGNVRYPALSADGRHLAYMVPKMTGGSGLWVKDLDSSSAIEIFSAPRCWFASWSPDGSHLLFGAIHAETDMGTYIIPRLGGEPRKIFDSPWPWCVWSPDGSRVANLGVGVNEVTIIDLGSGDTRGIDLGAGVARTGEVNYLDWSPAHDRLLFQVDDTRSQSFWTIRPDGTDPARLMEVRYDPKTLIANPRWAPQGDAVYYFRYSVRGQGVMDLMKIPTDRETGAVAGDPVTVLSGLHTTDDGFSISGDGTRFLYVQETNYANLWLVRVEGEAGSFVTKKTQLTTGSTWKSRAEISPDGTRIVFGMSSGEASNIYSMRLPDGAGGTAATESPRQLTFFNSLTDVPVWSPDGNEIAFYSAQGGMPRVWRMSNAGGTPKPFEEAEFESFVGDHLAWAPAGKILHRTVGIRNFSVFDPKTGASFPLVDADSLGYVFGPCWSPDGDRVAFFWNREEQIPPMGAWVKDITDGTMWRIADTVVQPLAWTPDGEYIWGMRFDVTAGGLNEVFKIPARGGEPVRWVNLPFEKIDSGRVSMTPDGLTFVYSRAERHADAWIVEDFDPDAD